MPSPSPSPSPSAAESSSSLFFLGGAVGAGTGVADGLPGPAVGAGTGVADGSSLTGVGAGTGSAVGAGIGKAVGAYTQTKLLLSQLPPVKQSLSTEQTSLRAQGGQKSQPQSTSVSPTPASRTSFLHSAIVGEGVGIVEGDPVVG